MWTIYVFPVKLNEYGIAYWSAAPYGSTSCTCGLRCVSHGCWHLSECEGGPVFRNLCLGLGCGGGPHPCTVPHGPAVLPHFFPHFCPRPPLWWPEWRWEHCCGLGGHMREEGVCLLCPHATCLQGSTWLCWGGFGDLQVEKWSVHQGREDSWGRGRNGCPLSGSTKKNFLFRKRQNNWRKNH